MVKKLRKKRFAVIRGDKPSTPARPTQDDDKTPDQRAVEAFALLAHGLEHDEDMHSQQVAAIALRFAVLKCLAAGLDGPTTQEAVTQVLREAAEGAEP